MTVERTENLWLIKTLATDPAIFPFAADDFAPEPTAWEPINSPHVCYLAASDECGAFGFGAFIPTNWACWRTHFGFLPRAYGEIAQQAFGRMLGWMWANTRARRIVGEICSENRRAIRFAERAGGEVFGLNRASWLKGGILRDQVQIGMSKPS